MQITATQIRVGMILVIEGELYRVTWTQHITPGKGVACMQTKLKHAVTGKNMEKRFRSADRVERASLEERSMQFLYEDPHGYVFMDNEHYEQMTLTKELVGDEGRFLTPEGSYDVSFHDGQVMGLSLPNSVELKVTVAPPEVRKATASGSLRPITLENDMVVQAPAFVKEGDVVRINTETGEYIERVSK